LDGFWSGLRLLTVIHAAAHGRSWIPLGNWMHVVSDKQFLTSPFLPARFHLFSHQLKFYEGARRNPGPGASAPATHHSRWACVQVSYTFTLNCEKGDGTYHQSRGCALVRNLTKRSCMRRSNSCFNDINGISRHNVKLYELL